jgi:hypothetical protein
VLHISRLLRPLVRRSAVLLALALLAAPGVVRGQTTASFDVAVYVPTPLQITITNGMNFGRFAAGHTTTTISPDLQVLDIGAADIVIGGAACSFMSVTFTLPNVMTGPGGATIPLTYTTNYTDANGTNVARTPVSGTGFLHQLTNSSGSCGIRYDEVSAASGIHYRMGGTSNATGVNTGGVYTATITVSVSYVDM